MPKKDEQQEQEKEEKDEDDEVEDDEDEDDEESNNKSTPSLLEKAAEYEAKRASTHPIANIQGDTSTGEEHEVTKFQVILIEEVLQCHDLIYLNRAHTCISILFKY